MTYEAVTQYRAKDGSLHGSPAIAREHDNYRMKEQIKKEVSQAISWILQQKVNDFGNLPEGWMDRNGKNYPTQEDICEAIVDKWDDVKEAMRPWVNANKS